MIRDSGLALVLGMLVLGGTAGCAGGSESDGSESDPETRTTSPVASTSPDATPVPTTTEEPVPDPPVVADGPCPYLDEGYVEDIVGQRMARVETITVAGQPAPDCIFYRPDESAAVTVDLTPYADPVAAQNAALSQVTAAAMPVTDIGDYGGVIVSSRQTLLAVTTGPLLVAVTTNQESSVQARELAATILAALPS